MQSGGGQSGMVLQAALPPYLTVPVFLPTGLYHCLQHHC